MEPGRIGLADDLHVCHELCGHAWLLHVPVPPVRLVNHGFEGTDPRWCSPACNRGELGLSPLPVLDSELRLVEVVVARLWPPKNHLLPAKPKLELQLAFERNEFVI